MPAVDISPQGIINNPCVVNIIIIRERLSNCGKGVHTDDRSAEGKRERLGADDPHSQSGETPRSESHCDPLDILDRPSDVLHKFANLRDKCSRMPTPGGGQFPFGENSTAICQCDGSGVAGRLNSKCQHETSILIGQLPTDSRHRTLPQPNREGTLPERPADGTDVWTVAQVRNLE